MAIVPKIFFLNENVQSLQVFTGGQRLYLWGYWYIFSDAAKDSVSERPRERKWWPPGQVWIYQEQVASTRTSPLLWRNREAGGVSGEWATGKRP